MGRMVCIALCLSTLILVTGCAKDLETISELEAISGIESADLSAQEETSSATEVEELDIDFNECYGSNSLPVSLKLIAGVDSGIKTGAEPCFYWNVDSLVAAEGYDEGIWVRPIRQINYVIVLRDRFGIPLYCIYTHLDKPFGNSQDPIGNSVGSVAFKDMPEEAKQVCYFDTIIYYIEFDEGSTNISTGEPEPSWGYDISALDEEQAEAILFKYGRRTQTFEVTHTDGVFPSDIPAAPERH